MHEIKCKRTHYVLPDKLANTRPRTKGEENRDDLDEARQSLLHKRIHFIPLHTHLTQQKNAQMKHDI